MVLIFWKQTAKMWRGMCAPFGTGSYIYINLHSSNSQSHQTQTGCSTHLAEWRWQTTWVEECCCNDPVRQSRVTWRCAGARCRWPACRSQPQGPPDWRWWSCMTASPPVNPANSYGLPVLADRCGTGYIRCHSPPPVPTCLHKQCWQNHSQLSMQPFILKLSDSDTASRLLCCNIFVCKVFWAKSCHGHRSARYYY